MEISVERKRLDKENIIVMVGGWKAPKIIFNRLKREVPRSWGFIHYHYTGDILNSDPYLTKKYCLKLMKQIVKELRVLSKIGKKKFYFYEQSLGGIFCVYALNKIDVKKAYFVVPGDNLAECFWKGKETRELKKEMEKKGITLTTLKQIWKPISPDSNFNGKAKKVKYFFKISVRDEIIPYKNGKKLYDLLKKKGYTIELSEGVLNHKETCLYECLFPERAIRFLTQDL